MNQTISLGNFPRYVAHEAVNYAQAPERKEIPSTGLIERICAFVKKLFIACADALLSLCSSNYTKYRQWLTETYDQIRPESPKEIPSSRNNNWHTLAKVALAGAGLAALGILAYKYISIPAKEPLDEGDALNQLTEKCEAAVNKFCVSWKGKNYCFRDFLSKNWIPVVTKDSSGPYNCDVLLESKNCTELVGNPFKLPNDIKNIREEWPFPFRQAREWFEEFRSYVRCESI